MLTLDKIRSYSLSGQDILDALDNQTKIITYKELKDYTSLEELLYPYGSVVILYLTREDYGHWCCLIKYPGENKVEFFDSYGTFVDEQLDYIKNKLFRKRLGQLIPYLSYLLYTSPYELFYNDHRFQKKGSDINTCGRWVTLRILCKDMDLEEFKEVFLKKNSDDIVSYLTAFIN